MLAPRVRQAEVIDHYGTIGRGDGQGKPSAEMSEGVIERLICMPKINNERVMTPMPNRTSLDGWPGMRAESARSIRIVRHNITTNVHTEALAPRPRRFCWCCIVSERGMASHSIASHRIPSYPTSSHPLAFLRTPSHVVVSGLGLSVVLESGMLLAAAY